MYTEEELINQLEEFAADRGQTPTVRAVQDADTMPSAQTYMNRFGSWNAAIEAAGLSPNGSRRSLTDEEMIERLQDFAADLGRSPTTRDVTDADELPTAATYQRRFGSWTAALTAAGLSPASPAQESYSQQALLTKLREFAADRGETPTVKAVNDADEMPSPSTFRSRFGSWNDALEAADLEPNWQAATGGNVDPLSDEEMLLALQAVGMELGRTPTESDMREIDAVPSVTTYARRFGSWNDALQEAGFELNIEVVEFTDEELLAQLRELAAEHETVPGRNHVDTADELPSAQTYANRFGSWPDSLVAAGLIEPA